MTRTIALLVLALSGCSMMSDFDEYKFADSDGGDGDSEVAGEDAGTDSGNDAGTDSAVPEVDAGTDSAVDAGVDSGPPALGVECDSCVTDAECAVGFGCSQGACIPSCDTCSLVCQDVDPRAPFCVHQCGDGCYPENPWEGRTTPGTYPIRGTQGADGFALAAACDAR